MDEFKRKIYASRDVTPDKIKASLQKIETNILVTLQTSLPNEARENLKVALANVHYLQSILPTTTNDEHHGKSSFTDEGFLTNAINLMAKNYANYEYDVNHFVNDMGYSKTLVNRKLKILAGTTIGQFMKQYRLSVARKMLMENRGEYNIKAVAYDVGFDDPKYFTKCYKSLFGYLPSQTQK